MITEEVRRIKKAYEKRREKTSSLYSDFFSRQREKEIKEAIKKEGINLLNNKKILDVGCGTGDILSFFLKEGAHRESLYGIDLLPERIEDAKRLYPGVHFHYGNAQRLTYPDEFFDIITQSTMFTSILDTRMKKTIACEIHRVLNPNGIIIWHDYRFSNPFNHDTKGIARQEIKNLFPSCQFKFKLINLNPFIARPLLKLSKRLCKVLENITILRTHWLVVIKKNSSYCS